MILINREREYDIFFVSQVSIFVELIKYREVRMNKYCLGIDIGGTSVKLGVFSEEGILLDKWEIPTRREEKGKYVLGDITASVNAKLDEMQVKKEDFIGAGIGVPGPITKDGTVLKCANLGWDIFNVATVATEMLGIKTKVGNDANVAALGEMWQGGGKGYQNIVTVTLGTGVGGGVIIDGEILPGSKGAAGEIGHVLVNYDEKDTCGCGKTGCLEQYASATGIVKEGKRLLERSEKSSKLRSVEDLTAKVIFDCAKEGDVLAMELVDSLGRYLGIALSHVAGVVDPEVFVIGGGVSKAGQILIEVIEKYYNQNVIFALKEKEFKLATLGNDAGIYGCAKLALGLK